MKAMDENCLDCKFYGKSIGNCDYFEIVGHMRGCPGGYGCTKKVQTGDRRYKVNRFYLKEENEVDKRRRKLLDSGLTDKEIADIEGVHRTSIQSWRKRNKLPCNKQSFYPHISEEEDSNRMALYKLGKSDSEIAKNSGCSPTAIRYWRERRFLEPNNTNNKKGKEYA